jgi:hypothetical protein
MKTNEVGHPLSKDLELVLQDSLACLKGSKTSLLRGGRIRGGGKTFISSVVLRGRHGDEKQGAEGNPEEITRLLYPQENDSQSRDKNVPDSTMTSSRNLWNESHMIESSRTSHKV